MVKKLGPNHTHPLFLNTYLVGCDTVHLKSWLAGCKLCTLSQVTCTVETMQTVQRCIHVCGMHADASSYKEAAMNSSCFEFQCAITMYGNKGYLHLNCMCNQEISYKYASSEVCKKVLVILYFIIEISFMALIASGSLSAMLIFFHTNYCTVHFLCPWVTLITDKINRSMN